MIKFRFRLAPWLTCLAAAITLWSAPAASQDADPDGEPSYRVTIRMDRFVFYSDEPVILHMYVKNNSDSRISFKAYDQIYTTYRPIVYDMNGREAETVVPYRLANKRVSDLVSMQTARNVELDADETMVYTINLRKLYNLPENRAYRIKGFFFPDAGTAGAIVSENTLQFRVVREISAAKKSGVERLKRGIAPSEIVSLMLQAEKAGRWQSMLKYLRIDSFITAFPEFSNTYSRADEKEKLQVEDDFVKFLSTRRSDYILDFKILSESIIGERNTAYVDARIDRYTTRLPMIYRYRYRLERYRDYWLVSHVEVSVMKAEK